MCGIHGRGPAEIGVQLVPRGGAGRVIGARPTDKAQQGGARITPVGILVRQRGEADVCDRWGKRVANEGLKRRTHLRLDQPSIHRGELRRQFSEQCG